MKEREFYYSVVPIHKKVTKEEFIKFIQNYPRKLKMDVWGACEPPLITYNDFELADRWPYSVVAKTHAWSNDPDHYYYAPEEEREYKIMENYEEVFASRTGNKTRD